MRRWLFGMMLVSAFSTAAFAQVSNGSFENPLVSPGTTVSLAPGSTIGTGWTVLGNAGPAVLLVETTYAETGVTFNAQNGLNHLDLTGGFNQGLTSGVQQSVATNIGQTYRVSFFVGRASGPGYSTQSTVDISINGGVRLPFTNSNITSSAVNWLAASSDFVATSSTTTIAFYNGQLTNNFTGLDNVSITLIPEPTAMASAAVCLMLAGRRRRRA